LTEINFEAFYQQRLANMAEQAKLAAEAGNTDAAATTH
jgi:preprotein translocase subunit SecB